LGFEQANWVIAFSSLRRILAFGQGVDKRPVNIVENDFIEPCIINGTLDIRGLTLLFGKRIGEDLFACGYC
jgi:hypothetical protein